MLPVSFRIPMEAALRIAQLAEKQGLSIGTFIRTQVLQGLDRPSDIHTRQTKKSA